MTTSISRSLAAALPKPKHTDSAPAASAAQSRGIRIVGPGDVDEDDTQPASTENSRAPPYGKRKGWRPRTDADYGDGGAYPEVAVAQYPHGMGKQTQQSSNALTLSVNREGKADHAGAIARRGHGADRIIHSSFSSLIPSRSADMALDRPSAEQAEETRQRTAAALEKLVSGATAASKPKSISTQRAAPQYVQYTSADQMGDGTKGRQRLIKIVERQKDPMEPPKHKHKRIPGRAPSPPPPIMHSPPRKLDAETQEAWRIPPSVSNWKNPKGYTVPLDKRLAADGRGLQDVTISDRFAQFSEALSTADRHIREEVKQRALIQQKLAENEKLQKEENLRALAQKAREDRAAAAAGGAPRRSSRLSSRSPSASRSRSRSVSPMSASDSDASARRERERARRERREENQRELRQSRMGHERRVQAMAREQNRDISEKVALGLAKPTASGEAMYDSRLFSRGAGGFATGVNEDQAYDAPLFAARDAINSIYRPGANAGDDDGDDGGEAMERIDKASRFDVLGRAGAGRGFAGAEGAEAREGPVQFEKDAVDPFGIDAMIRETVAGGGGAGAATAGGKRYGMQDEGAGGADARPSKRARVDDDDGDED